MKNLAIILIMAAFCGTAAGQSIQAKLGGNDGGQSFYIINSDGDTVAVFKSDGKVGIGTTGPVEMLDVNGNVIADTLKGDGSQLTGIDTDDADADSTNELQGLSSVLSQDADAGGSTISNLADPSGDQDAATKIYVDGQLDKMLILVDGEFTDDRDGNTYDVVKIGDQVWMAENLNYGTMVNLAVTQSNNGTVEKYCYGNSESNCTSNGGSYVWNEAMQYGTTPGSQGICPNGWHLPTDAEWKTLEMALGMSQAQADAANTFRGTDEGTKLKQGGSSGFNALLSGYRYNGNWFYWNSYGKYLTSSLNGGNVWERMVTSSSTQVYRSGNYSRTHFSHSVRCVMD